MKINAVFKYLKILIFLFNNLKTKPNIKQSKSTVSGKHTDHKDQQNHKGFKFGYLEKKQSIDLLVKLKEFPDAYTGNLKQLGILKLKKLNKDRI
ncbi:hypothetical protein TTHERM_001013367 (macronuclear) [Tetrahymena thermophila SB210]|uniref:Uncharacterized protein n=1 Tax=Tetrahymena thermophila (strain SB210) TaxID=312017 RepID=W7XHJ4_TETTS|nr:hypothetical protein TTHERM_001013367 [Tetrahymena thermophila SB210]EWS76753.1 hypothetical protein TTHERM_001013367 [Tetrahymena thermophila SB210]|eukprot:XP_012650715.1 hypothetical protein TTHERM_001013367 [Tetrahymena thermophila SB210]